MSDRFPFLWDPTYRIAALPFGVVEQTAWVRVGADELEVRFGLWRLRTRIDNVVAATRSGGFSFAKTAGPPHLSLSDRGVTFATNGRHGICLELRRPVAAIDPLGVIKHPGVTLTLADPDGLCAALGVALR